MMMYDLIYIGRCDAAVIVNEMYTTTLFYMVWRMEEGDHAHMESFGCGSP